MTAPASIELRDCPVTTAYTRRVITSAQYSAAMKYRHHWHHAGVRGLELSLADRTVPPDGGDAQKAFHGRQYAIAVQHLGKEHATLLDATVCYRRTLEQAGRALGAEGEKHVAVAVAIKALRQALDSLCYLWQI